MSELPEESKELLRRVAIVAEQERDKALAELAAARDALPYYLSQIKSSVVPGEPLTLPEAVAYLAARLRDSASEATNHLALMRERDRELDQIEAAYQAEIARLRKLVGVMLDTTERAAKEHAQRGRALRAERPSHPAAAFAEERASECWALLDEMQAAYARSEANR